MANFSTPCTELAGPASPRSSSSDAGPDFTFLGSSTPIKTIVYAEAGLKPAAVVLSAVTRQPFEAGADGIRHLSCDIPVLMGGEGASEALGKRLGAQALQSDPVRAAAGMPTST